MKNCLELTVISRRSGRLRWHGHVIELKAEDRMEDQERPG